MNISVDKKPRYVVKKITGDKNNNNHKKRAVYFFWELIGRCFMKACYVVPNVSIVENEPIISLTHRNFLGGKLAVVDL